MGLKKIWKMSFFKIVWINLRGNKYYNWDKYFLYCRKHNIKITKKNKDDYNKKNKRYDFWNNMKT